MTEFDPGAKIRENPVKNVLADHEVEYQGNPDDDFDYLNPEISEFDPGAKFRDGIDKTDELRKPKPFKISAAQEVFEAQAVVHEEADYLGHPEDDFDYLNDDLTEFDPGAKIRVNFKQVSQIQPKPVTTSNTLTNSSAGDPDFIGYPEDDQHYLNPNLSEFDPGSKIGA